MEENDLANSGSTAYQRRFTKTSFCLACSVSVASPMVLAHVAGPTPAFQAMPPRVGNFPDHNAGAATPKSSGYSSTVYRSSTAGNWQSTAASIQSSKNKTQNSTFSSAAPGAHDLDLASSQANIPASSLGGFHDLTIVVGGVKQVVSLNSQLTGGETVAAAQVLDGGKQTIKLAAGGQATGGSITLNSTLLTTIDGALGGSIDTLTVPHGVKVIDSVSQLSLSGSLDNDGSILTASSVAHATDTISATTIVNAAGGTIASYSSSAGTGLFAADPVLNALTSISNSGTIGSANNLSLSAPAISNGAVQGETSAQISARNNVNISTASLTNGAVISAQYGNVNLGNAGALTLSNSGGTVAAPNGNINLASSNAALSVTGGDLLSRQVNLKAGEGEITVNADDISGVINASGDSVHVITLGTQTIGNIDTTGDPNFVAAGAGANLIVDGTITPTNGADLALIANGNVVSSSKAVIDTSTTAAGDGGNLTIVAGAQVNVAGNVATVTGGSSGGGIIDLTGKNGGSGAVSSITTAGTGATGNGGYIQMVAFAGSAAGSGTINLPAKVTVNSAGSGSGTSGEVELIAGATSGTAITAGPITAGQVSLQSQTPTVNSGSVSFTNGTSSAGIAAFGGTLGSTTASVLAGNITSTQGIAITTGGSVTTGNLNVNGNGTGVSGTNGTAGGTISVNAAGNIVTGAVNAYGGGGVGGGTGGSINGGNGGAGGIANLTTSGGNITVTGNVNVSGGGGGGGAGSNPTSETNGTGGTGGTAGTVDLSAAGAVSVSGEVFAYDGGAGGRGGNGGTIASGGGGGGGGSYGGAGGGGAAGVSSGAANAGGGGGGGSIASPGGGGAGSTGGSAQASGGLGGGNVVGLGGISTSGGTSGAAGSGTKGGSGGRGSNIAGGAGGSSPKGGTAGSSTLAAGAGTAGGQAVVQAGDGTFNLTVSGGSAGTSKKTLTFEGGALTVTTTGAGSAFLNDISGATLDINGITTGATGTVSIATKPNAITGTTGGTIVVNDPLTGGTINLTTSGTTANIDVNSTISGISTLTTTGANTNIAITNVISGTSTTISTIGTITTTGAGSINAITATLIDNKALSVTTDATNLSITDRSANVTINQGATNLNLLNSTVATTTGITFTLDCVGELNVAGTILASPSSTLTLDSSGAAGGINLANAISAGTINITTAGSGGITCTPTGKATGGIITLTSANNIGAVNSPVIVDNNLALGKGNTLNITTGASGNAFITDLGTSDLALNVNTNSSGTLSVSSAASAFNVVQAPFATVILTDTNTLGVTTLNSGSTATVLIGNGNGPVTINSGGSILMNANNNGIEGTAISLTSKTGDVGGEIDLVANAPNITAIAPDGEVGITTNQTGTVNVSGGPGVQFYFNDPENNANVILNGPLPCGWIQIQCIGTGSNITCNGTLGISDKNNGYTVQLNPTNNLTINGNIIADDVFLGSNHFTGLPVLLGTLLVNGAITADDTVEFADNQSKGITVNSAIIGNNVIMMSDIGNINLNASITAITNTEPSTGFINLSSNGASIVCAPGVSLTATGFIGITTGTGSIGSAGNPVITSAPGINLSFGGSVYINNKSTGTLPLVANSTGTTGAFVFNNTGGGVNFEGSINSGSIILTSTGPISIGSRADISNSNPTTLASTGVLTITSTGGVTNYGALSGTNVSIGGTSFNNISLNGLAQSGTLSASTALAFTSPSGGLTILGATGSIATPLNGSLTLIAPGAITIGGATTDPLSDVATAGDYLHSLVVSAGGNLNVGWSGLTVTPDASGDGGIINISATNLVNNGPALKTAFDLFASGATGSGTGGVIIFNLPGNTSGITTGTATGDYNINASGSNGGTVYLQTAGNITANMSNLLFDGTSANATAASISLIAGGKLLINGLVDTHNGTGAYGPVVLSSGSSQPFIIGGAAGTTNGQINSSPAQGIFGSTVSITDNAGITVSTGYTVQAFTGALSLNTTNLINDGTVSSANVLQITNKGNITYPPGGTGGTFNISGLILDSTGGNVTLTSSIPSPFPPVAWTELEILAPNGTVTLPSTVTSLSVAPQGVNGGTLDITAKTLSASVLSLSAPGTTGTGGTIDFDITGTKGLTVGTGAYTFDVAGGTPGSLTLASSGNLTVNGSGITLGTGSGGSLALEAGTAKAKGTLLVSNIASLISANQPFNNLILQSNSSAALSLGGATTKTNGIIDGGIALTANTVTIANYGGGIIQGTGGTLTATGAGANAMYLIAGKGGIGVSGTTPLAVSAGNLGVSTSGSAFLSNTSAVTLGTVSVGGTLNYASATQGISAAGTISAPTLILNLASITPTITTNASTIAVTATNGAVTINDTQTKTVTVNNLSSSGAVSLTGAAGITTSATSTVTGSAITLTAGGKAGSIDIGNSITSAAGTVDLSATGTGTIIEGGKTTVVTAGTLNLVTQGGIIGGSQTKPFVIDAGVLSVNSGSSTKATAFIKNSDASTTINASTVGGTFNYAGAITAASGPITTANLVLTLSSMGAGDVLTTNAATIMGATAAGSLDINDTQTGLVKINTASATGAGGLVEIASAGSITTIGTITAAGGVSLTAGGTAGTITIGKNITGSGAGSVVTLLASGTGSIVESSGTVGGGTVNLTTTGGSIGATTKAVATSGSTINVQAGTTGNVFVTNSDTQLTGSVSLNPAAAANVGSLKFTEINTSAKNTGTLTVNSIDAQGIAGSITISSNEQMLAVGQGSNISTFNGNITLQNTYAPGKTNLPSIVIGNSTATTIHASSTGSFTTGNLFIALGTVPTALTVTPGVAPTINPPTLTGPSTNLITYGTKTTLTGSITTGAGDTFNSIFRNLSFTTGKNPATQIQVGANVTLIADPPAGVASALPEQREAVMPAANMAQMALMSQISQVALPQSMPQSAAGISARSGSVAASFLEGSGVNILAAPNTSQLQLSGLSDLSGESQLQAQSQWQNQWQNQIQITPGIRAGGTTDMLPGTGNSAKKSSILDGKVSQMRLTGKVSSIAHQILGSGAGLFAPDKDTIYQTDFGSIAVARGAVALIINSAQGLAVYNLHDTHKDSVLIKDTDDNSIISLLPGRNAVLTSRQTSQFQYVNPAQKVAYKKIASRAVAGRQLFDGQFEIISMIGSVGPIRDLLKSNASEMRKTAGKMLKTAVILSQLSDGEPYRFYAMPEVTASLPERQN